MITGTQLRTGPVSPERTGAGPQQRIAALRASLLDGYGPGASAAEAEAHQRQRVRLGALPVTVAREQVALDTRRAQAGSIDPVLAQADQRLSDMADAAQSSGTGPRRGTGRRWDVALGVALGVGLGVAIGSRRGR